MQKKGRETKIFGKRGKKSRVSGEKIPARFLKTDRYFLPVKKFGEEHIGDKHSPLGQRKMLPIPFHQTGADKGRGFFGKGALTGWGKIGGFPGDVRKRNPLRQPQSQHQPFIRCSGGGVVLRKGTVSVRSKIPIQVGRVIQALFMQAGMGGGAEAQIGFIPPVLEVMAALKAL